MVDLSLVAISKIASDLPADFSCEIDDTIAVVCRHLEVPVSDDYEDAAYSVLEQLYGGRCPDGNRIQWMGGLSYV
jgi:hypothetical protein